MGEIGIDPADVQFIDGDTDRVAFGMGSNGSRSMVTGGSALVMAADKVVEKGKKIAAHLMEAAAGDIEFADGRFSIAGTDRAVTLKQVAMAAFQPARLPPGIEPGLYENATYAPKRDTFPNGCHVAEVEVDPDTGEVELLSYIVVDDVGTVINPLTLAGQIHGGVAQGVGQILMEQVVYDRESGQLLSASFMDYAMPLSSDLPSFELDHTVTLTDVNPLGVKGVGEAGTIGSTPAVAAAVADALGVAQLDMPFRPEKLWKIIHQQQ